MTRLLCAVGCAVLLVAFSDGFRPASAQSPRQLLRDARSASCEFKVAASGSWAADGTATAQTKTVTLTVAFSEIDTQDGTAALVSKSGAPQLVVQMTAGALHFMQVGSTGTLYTTTIFDRAGHPGTLKAVHTRHEYTEVSLPGYTSRPEQYYGECAVKP